MNEVPDPLLRDALRISLGGTSDGCLNAEALARFADGALTRTERAAVETHAARCARCQAMLAVMQRTAPAAAEPSRSWFRVRTLGWIAPLTAALVLLVWVAIPDRERQARSAAESDASVPAVATPLPSADRDAAPATQPPSPMALARQALQAPISPPTSAARDELKPRKREAPPNPRQPPAHVERQDAKPQAAPAAETSAPAEQERVMTPAAAQAAPNTFSRAERRMMLDAGAAPPAVTIASPVTGTRWRITHGPTIERTVDGGATWELQDIGVSATPTAGAAPSPLVCWLVGPQGLVLLTTDGHSWNRVRFPDRSDLMWVRAGDAKTATVATQGGSTWSTQDGGVTWTRP